MEKKVSKRELILDSALSLFSDRGFDGVGIDEIGESVGMKGPALYYYFKGKDAILDGIIETVAVHYESHFGSAAHVGPIPASLEEFTEATLARLNFTIHDPVIRKIRRLLTLEQYRNDRIRDQMTLHNYTGTRDLYTVIFAGMMEKGLLKQVDPSLLAFEFTAPVTVLIQLLDREPDREEEVMTLIHRHIDHFLFLYSA